ncbi:fruit protein pKIWI502 [Gossypium raimondii]|uniref:FAD-binding FR-type domain-containing protein n=1 Tax=Gossypium raimondii TaxID=29730 RepID=A0A0D2UY37_GOSRA|nr:fruit protein pKIWI502 [Gossypium raimondii]KJB61120.1 hypothetical protein B456_009G341900 [Gossypium raimondii]
MAHFMKRHLISFCTTLAPPPSLVPATVTIFYTLSQVTTETMTVIIPSLPHAHLSAPPLPMSILRRLPFHSLTPCHYRPRRRFATLAAVRQDTTVWTPTPISSIETAAESLFHISIDVSSSPDLAASHTLPGQYLQLRLPDVEKPSFLAIASPPSLAASSGAFEFLVKSVAGSTAELLCGLKKGDVVELSQAMGNGFNIDKIDPPEDYPTVLIFATGSGISPIRSLIESGFGADKRSDVRLYYGARNLRRMAYQDRFKEWESSGVKVVPVLSQPDDSWTGESGYVQAAFSRAKQIHSPKGTGAVLCGQRQMTEEVTSILVADGVSSEKILKNF